MAEATTVRAESRFSLPRLLVYAALALVAVTGVRFWTKDAVPYFLDISAEEWGRYWGMRLSFFAHILGGSLALVMGPFQFWSGLRRRHLSVHKWTGRLYLGGIVIGTAGSIQIALTNQVGLGWMIALFGLAFAWVLTSGMAFYAILNRMIDLHKQWMIRSYVVTFGFVTFRVFNQNEMVAEWMGMERFATLGWMCWAIPLLVTEVVFGVQAVRRKARA